MTRPTDNNLFSARRSVQDFLSRLKDDRSKGKIASDIGFEVGNYLAGVSGGMFGVEAGSGQGFADLFKLFVHGKAYFETLAIIEAQTLAGKQYITPGGAVKCTSVTEKGLVDVTRQRPVTDESGNPVVDADGNPVMEEYTEMVDNGVPEEVYRCYFLSEQDGEKTETKIVAGDQAISEMFNAKVGTANKISNHRYWRLVTSVSNDAYTDNAGNHYGYIELSKTDCESGSDIPKAGDIIDQFGNRDDVTRQSAMVFSTVDPDAPSIKMYGGINSFTLEGKAMISFGQNPVTHQVYFRLGTADATQYLDYKQGQGLVLAGKLSVGSTVGDTTLGDLIENSEQSAVTVQILTDKGNVLLNGEGQRNLTAYVYFRNENVTDRIYGGRFSWTRTSDDTTGDKIWNRLHEGIGRHCTVTDGDVDRNAVFACEVDISGTWLDAEAQN